MSRPVVTEAGRWYAACLYAGSYCWTVVRQLPPVGWPYDAQLQAHPARRSFAFHEQARAAAEALNAAEAPAATAPPPPAPRLRPADHYGQLPEVEPHPWDLK